MVILMPLFAFYSRIARVELLLHLFIDIVCIYLYVLGCNYPKSQLSKLKNRHEPVMPRFLEHTP